jgi:7-cyano-7-deazaguanine synthase
MTKALVVFSGGQDSTTCLYWAKMEYGDGDVLAITFDYNQRHRVEIEAATKIAKMANVDHEIVTLGPILKGTSPLVSGAELEQYADHQSLPGGLEKTFVPMRNQLFLTIAANRAAVLSMELGVAVDIVTGVCQEDYGGYPDCRRDFIDFLMETIQSGTEMYINIETPLMYLTKAESVLMAAEMPGCMDALAYSHTAYDGAYPPTGHDHATLLRAKGFEKADLPDPLVLRAWREGLMKLPHTPNYWEVTR